MKPLTTAVAVGISFQIFPSFGHRYGSKIVHPLDLMRLIIAIRRF